MQLSVKFILLITTVVMINLANGKENIGNPIVTVAQQQTAIPNAPGHVKHRKIVKSKVQRTQPFGIDENDEDVVQNDDLATGYRRRDLNKIEHHDGISERVRWRLFLARQLALMKYREIHGIG
jgi:hypothetical protein